MQAVLANPQFRSVARNVGLAALRGLGRSRSRRAKRGKWYFGKRVGIPPARRRNANVLLATTSTSAPVARSARVATNPTTQRFNAVGVDWLCDVSNTTTLNPSVYSYSVNPAEPSSFPRLANIATQYQRYEFQSLSITYTPTCPTTQKGMLYIAPIRDPTSPLPDTVVAMRGLSGCLSCAVRDPMTVTVSRAQLSSALNGFYCEAPDGVDPSEDNALRTCGRIAVMTDGVVKGDNSVGSIVLKYNFLLSDPKITPEGAALAGGLTYGAFTGSLDAGDYVTRVGKPALTVLADGTLQKRCIGPVLLITRGTAGSSPAYTLEVDGVEAAAGHILTVGSQNVWKTWWLGPGRQSLVFKSTAGLTTFFVDAVATGAAYDPVTSNQ